MWPDRDKLDRRGEDNSGEIRELLRDKRLEASPETSEFESRRGRKTEEGCGNEVGDRLEGT